MRGFGGCPPNIKYSFSLIYGAKRKISKFLATALSGSVKKIVEIWGYRGVPYILNIPFVKTKFDTYFCVQKTQEIPQ